MTERKKNKEINPSSKASRGNFPEWKCRDREMMNGNLPLIMGILNVTPDSFSDGGKYVDTSLAVQHGLALERDGADIIDVGGESSRPGAENVSLDEELKRVIPVIQELAGKVKCAISIDTTKAEVAKQAIDAGASIINDISAMTMDPEMINVARDTGAGIILMHMRGSPRTMQDNPVYTDVVKEVKNYLRDRIEHLRASGINIKSIAVDPGIGFGKTVDHNIALLANLKSLYQLGRPVIVGLSRKSFLGKLTGKPVEARLAGSIAATTFCVMNGASVLRAHDAGETLDAVKVVSALVKQKDPEEYV